MNKVDEILIRLHTDGWNSGKKQLKTPTSYTLKEKPKAEAKSALYQLLIDSLPEKKSVEGSYPQVEGFNQAIDEMKQAINTLFKGEK